MSKIFDALSKTQGEIASLALPLVEKAGKSDTAAHRHSNTDLEPPIQEPKVRTSKFSPVRLEEVRTERLGRIIVHSDPTSLAADRFRLLRMRLRNHWTTGKLKSILITSPLPEDGRTTVALNLATAMMEEQGRSVLLIDADLHRGSLDERLGLVPQTGLTECLQEGIQPLSAIRQVRPFGWHFLSSGKVRTKSPAEVLQPNEISNLIQKMSPHFDWIVVDSPPVLPLSDAVALRDHLDGTLMIARAGVTPAKAVEDAVARIGR